MLMFHGEARRFSRAYSTPSSPVDVSMLRAPSPIGQRAEEMAMLRILSPLALKEPLVQSRTGRTSLPAHVPSMAHHVKGGCAAGEDNPCAGHERSRHVVDDNSLTLSALAKQNDFSRGGRPAWSATNDRRWSNAQEVSFQELWQLSRAPLAVRGERHIFFKRRQMKTAHNSTCVTRKSVTGCQEDENEESQEHSECRSMSICSIMDSNLTDRYEGAVCTRVWTQQVSQPASLLARRRSQNEGALTSVRAGGRTGARAHAPDGVAPHTHAMQCGNYV